MKRIKQSLNRLKIDVDKGWEKENILSNILDNEDPPPVERKKGGEEDRLLRERMRRVMNFDSDSD